MAQQTYLSQGGVENIKKELQELKTKKRLEIAKRLQEAKDLGDLSENVEYFEAKEAQSFNESRIIELEKLLKNAVVIETSSEHSIVKVGSTVDVKSINGAEVFNIVGSAEAKPEKGK
ncbi:MAG: transcription elongation factor GreA, partial [Patescibacteria group bacterium]